MSSQPCAPSVLEQPVETTDIDELVYVYAILPAEPLATLPAICMDSSRPIYTLENDHLQVVASRLRPAYFDQAALKANLQDPVWLETHVRIHQHVLDQVVAAGKPSLPLRFCTIYRNEADVRQMLADHQETLVGELQRFLAKQEWGVKLFVTQTALEAAIRNNDAALSAWRGIDEITALQAQIATMSRGAAFLVKKKLDAALVRVSDTIAFAIADDSHARLTGCAVEAVTNALPQQLPEIHLNAAYLVATEKLAAFRQELEQLGEAYWPVGIRYELSGPWPPYNFLHLDLAS